MISEYTSHDISKILNDNPLDIFEIYHDDSLKDKLIDMKNLPNIDYFNLAYLALNNVSSNAWNIGNILKELVPYSKYDIDNIMSFFNLLHDKEDSISVHFPITKILSENDYMIAKKLLSKLLEENKTYHVASISAILSVLHNEYNENQYEVILNFLGDDHNILHLKYGISFINEFNFSDEELKNIFELFKNKVKLSNEEIDRELLYVSYDLIKKGYEYFSEILLLYINNENIIIKNHLSHVLFLASKKYCHKKWFKDAFLALIDTNIEGQNIIRNIEFILNKYLEIDDFNFIEKFLYKWIEKGNLSTLYSKTTLSMFSPKFNEHKLFSKFVTKALVGEDSKLHSILPELIMKNTKLDIEEMNTFNRGDYLYVCRKILGYFYEFSRINTMIYSILSVDDLQENIKNLVLEIFVNHIGKDYPYDTLEYFKNLEDSKLNENEKEAKNTVIIELEKRNEQIQNLPRLKELSSPLHQIRKIQRANSISMNETMKKVEKDSIMSLLGTKIPICCGRGWFSEFRGTFTDVSYMGSHSHSITVPVATRTHPISFELARYHFRIVKKGQ